MQIPPEAIGTVTAAVISGCIAIALWVLSRVLPAPNPAQTEIPVKFSADALRTIDRLDNTVEKLKTAVAILEPLREDIPDLSGRVRTLESYMKELRDGFVTLRDGVRDIQNEAHKTKHALTNMQQRNKAVDDLAVKEAALRLAERRAQNKADSAAIAVAEDERLNENG